MAAWSGEGPEVHVPVLVSQVLAWLDPRSGGIYLDGTVGAGGHAERILERSAPDGVVLAADRDGEVLELARRRLARFGPRARLFHGRISGIGAVLDREGIAGLDGFLLDLGVSSYQLDRPDRGFSFSHDGPLDMRMDRKEDCWTAAEVVNRLPERELADALFRFGEEGRSRRIARAIVERRRKRPFSRTGDLAAFVEELLGRHGRTHPATKVFQALRVAVNRELEELESGLEQLLARLGPRGRAVVVSFHSLEDRIVKEAFRRGAREGRLRLLTRKPAVAGREERAENRRSRSAKLRAAERIG